MMYGFQSIGCFLVFLHHVVFLIMHRWFIIILLHFWMKVVTIDLQSERYKVNVLCQDCHEEGNAFVAFGFECEDCASEIDGNVF